MTQDYNVWVNELKTKRVAEVIFSFIRWDLLPPGFPLSDEKLAAVFCNRNTPPHPGDENDNYGNSNTPEYGFIRPPNFRWLSTDVTVPNAVYYESWNSGFTRIPSTFYIKLPAGAYKFTMYLERYYQSEIHTWNINGQITVFNDTRTGFFTQTIDFNNPVEQIVNIIYFTKKWGGFKIEKLKEEINTKEDYEVLNALMGANHAWRETNTLRNLTQSKIIKRLGSSSE